MRAAGESRLKLMGAPGSPYTRKMLALLRYRRIPYAILWGGHQNPPPDLPQPKVKLLPTFYFQGANGDFEAVVDSTPITRRLEQEYAGRSVIPESPALAFLNELIEDYADEWLTKAMFHYRWYFEADRDNAGPLLVYWSLPTLAAPDAQKMADMFSKRQTERLYVVGSNDVTASTIESSYLRFIDLLDTLLQPAGYVLGARPSSADFAIYGQLTQLAIVEPTSAALTRARSARVRAWLDRMEDLSGLEPDSGDWFTPEQAEEHLKPLLCEIGRVYLPFLKANAAAVVAGQSNFETEIDGQAWSQPTFPYQAKCLQHLRETAQALSGDVRNEVRSILSGTGCEELVD
ncbi:glutathione S-transferase family protein [uncultured Hyphomonas sp.]|uniref:glutathione S-transferase family protein n=1 Tax=uncultured Hyphomonas sp. TaxID=225298 RepID=UPI002AABD519|nr:glutathione S-transferase family protein [uncultured Hyphomonas sp.]